MNIRKVISGVLSAAMILSAFPAVSASGNVDKADASFAINAYVDENGEVVTNNMSVYMGDVGNNTISVKGGKKGWLFDVVSDVKDFYLYMDIDDKLTDSVDKGRIVEISVDYFDFSEVDVETLDQGVASFTIQYVNRLGKTVETPYKEFQNSLSWRTHTFVINDALLTNGVNGADFRLCSKTNKMATSADSFVVSKVDVNLTDKFNQVNIAPSTDEYGNNFFTGMDIDFKYTFDNSFYAVDSFMNGKYPIDLTFVAKSYEGETMFEKKDTVVLAPGKKTDYELNVDIGGRYGVYYLTCVAENKEHNIYSENTTRFSYTRTDYGETINYKFGVCAGRRPEWAPLYQNAGIGLVRAMESYTNVTSRNLGADEAFIYPLRGYTVQRSLKERNINQFNTLMSVSNDIIPGEHLPHTERGLDAYVDYINFTAESEKHAMVSYDMWNEYNILGSKFNLYSRPLSDYIKLMKRAYTELKKNNPELKLYGVVTSYIDTKVLRSVLEAGGGDYMDGFCTHAYKPRQDPMSGGNVDLFWEIRKILDEYGYTDMPIVSSELGFVDDTYYGIDELKQGYYLVEYYVALQKIPHFDEYVMYQFHDGGQVKGNREHHWGLIEFQGAALPGTAKASYPMIATLNNMLAGYEFKDDITVNDDTYAYRFYNEEKHDETIVLWARGAGGTVTLDLGVDSVELYDSFGNLTKLKGIDGKYNFALTEEPMYLKGDMKKFELAENIFVDVNEFTVEFSQNINFDVKNPTGKPLNVEIKPRDNDDLNFVITDNENGSKSVFVKGARTVSERDISTIKIDDGENVYLTGYVVMDYTAPIDAELTAAPYVDADGKRHYDDIRLKINVLNKGSEVVKGKLMINRFDGVESYQPLYENLTIEARGSKEIEISVPLDVTSYELEASFITDEGIIIDFTRNTSIAVAKYAETKPTIDGKLSENEYGNMIYLGPDNVIDVHAIDPYVGADDYSARLSYSWDEENFYIAMECIDNTLYDKSPDAGSMWRYDSFQLAGVYDPDEKFDPSILTSVLYGNTNGVSTLSMVKENAIKKMTDADSGFEGAITREGTSTTYEVKIPWKTMLPEEREVLPETTFKFTVLANDNDGGGRKAAVQYGEGIYSGGVSSAKFINAHLVK